MKTLDLTHRNLRVILTVLALPLTSVAQVNYATPYTFITFAGNGPDASSDGTGIAARFNFPSGVAHDAAGDLYVADFCNHTIRKATLAGEATTLAGLAGYEGSLDGTASAARFSHPVGMAFDSFGNAYVADTLNHAIRKVSPAGEVTTLAGTGGTAGFADGTGPAARAMTPTRRSNSTACR